MTDYGSLSYNQVLTNFHSFKWSIKMWKDAAIQVLFSLGISFGCLPTISSFNSSGQNIVKYVYTRLDLTCAEFFFDFFVVLD